MVLSRAVEHYLHLREQGMSHERAVEHTRLRHGVLPGELTADLRQARGRLLAAVALIPPACNTCDATGERYTNRCGGGTMVCECAR